MKRVFQNAMIAVLVLVAAFARGNIMLPTIIADHMVLQQNAECRLWGWASAMEMVTVSNSWDTTTAKVKTDRNGNWMLTIKTPKAGGPFTLTFKGNNTITVSDVVTGEVWDCSGQSNMEMHHNWGNQLYGADMDSATNKNIRFFFIPRTSSEFPQDDTRGRWVVCNPTDVKDFSMVGYFFGKQLEQYLHVPVGLINANWGGTPAESWTPAELINSNAVLKTSADSLAGWEGAPRLPGYNFNAMIHPIINYNIAGVIWYQGEANVDQPKTYQQLMATMIGAWRAAFRKDFPFYFVQLAPYAGYGKGNKGSLIREQQSKTLLVPNTGMIVITDLIENVKDIHPRHKKEVGLRMANLALSKTYNVPGLPYKYPEYKSISIENGNAKITFDDAGKGLMAKGDTIRDFFVAGADKVFVPAQAKIDGNTVIVYSREVKQPVAVRFGFYSASMPNLFSKEGLPANIFRTDDWDDVPTIR